MATATATVDAHTVQADQAKSIDATVEALKPVFASFPADAVTAFNTAYGDLAKTDILKRAKQVGDLAPSFTLSNIYKKPVTLGEHLCKGPVILIFYRGSWCPFCNIQIRALQRAQPLFKEVNATVLAVSGQTPEAGAEFQGKTGADFEILTDEGFAVAKAYGTYWSVGEGLMNVNTNNFGINWANLYGDNSLEDPGLTIAASYVIGTDGAIKYAFLETDFTKRAPIDELVAAAKAAQA